MKTCNYIKMYVWWTESLKGSDTYWLEKIIEIHSKKELPNLRVNYSAGTAERKGLEGL